MGSCGRSGAYTGIGKQRTGIACYLQSRKGVSGNSYSKYGLIPRVVCYRGVAILPTVEIFFEKIAMCYPIIFDHTSLNVSIVWRLGRLSLGIFPVLSGIPRSNYFVPLIQLLTFHCVSSFQNISRMRMIWSYSIQFTTVMMLVFAERFERDLIMLRTELPWCVVWWLFVGSPIWFNDYYDLTDGSLLRRSN